MYDIGIIGGMGPKATSKLFEMIVDYTDAKSDQEHPSVLIVNDSKTPDRTAYLTKKSEISPLGHLLESVNLLNLTIETEGSIGMVCNTAHYFYEILRNKCTRRIINMPSMTLKYISISNLNKNVCILGTLGTIETGVYKKYCPENISLIYPDEEERETVQRIIYQIKNTENADYKKCAIELSTLMRDIGNYTFVFACTELSILEKKFFIEHELVDAMEILAISLINQAGYNVDFSKVKYERSFWSNI